MVPINCSTLLHQPNLTVLEISNDILKAHGLPARDDVEAAHFKEKDWHPLCPRHVKSKNYKAEVLQKQRDRLTTHQAVPVSESADIKHIYDVEAEHSIRRSSCT